MDEFEISGKPWKVYWGCPTDQLEETLNIIETQGEYQITQMVPPMGDRNEWTILTRRAASPLQQGSLPPDVEAALEKIRDQAESASDA